MSVEIHTLKDGTTLMAFVGDYIGNVLKRTATFYERGMLKYIKDRVKSGTFIDVGANIGNHTVFFGKYCDADVIAFEPYQPSFNVLKENVRANSIRNCRIVRVALSDTVGVALMLSNPDNIGMTKIVDENGSHNSVDYSDKENLFDVDVTTLDKYINELMPALKRPITCIKLDCEGYEPNALRGMLSTIDVHKPVLFVECIDDAAYNSVTAILSVLNYKSVRVFNATPTHMFVHSTQVNEHG